MKQNKGNESEIGFSVRTFLEKFIVEKTKVRLTTTKGRIFTGVIVGMTDNSILLIDKFGSDVMLGIDEVKGVAAWVEGQSNGKTQTNGADGK